MFVVCYVNRNINIEELKLLIATIYVRKYTLNFLSENNCFIIPQNKISICMQSFIVLGDYDML